MRNWGWQRWLILIGAILLGILIIIVIYVIARPDAFRPALPPEVVAPPLVGLPPVIEEPPEFPVSEVERVPLTEIQGVGLEPGLDIIARGGVTQVSNITNFPVDFATLSPNGQDINYYDPELGQFFRVNEDGVITKAGGKIFAQAESVVWAPNSEDTIIEFPDGSNILYNFETEEQITLPAHWKEFQFSSDSSSIAFKSIALDPNENWLAVADKDGSRARRIEHLGNNEDIVDIDWSPNNQVIGTYSEQDGLARSKLFFIGFNGENFQLSKLHGKKFEGSWAPDGKNLVYSVMHQDTNFNPSLWVVDGSGTGLGQNRKHIGLPTWSHKCTYATPTTMYCGVPKDLPRGAGLIPSIADDVPDDIYKVDITTGVTTRVAIPVENLQVKQLQVSEDGSSLYIINGFSGSVQKIDLTD